MGISSEVAAQVVDAGDAPGVSGGDGGQDDVRNGLGMMLV
jgi:hypothetical protein